MAEASLRVQKGAEQSARDTVRMHMATSIAAQRMNEDEKERKGSRIEWGLEEGTQTSERRGLHNNASSSVQTAAVGGREKCARLLLKSTRQRVPPASAVRCGSLSNDRGSG